MGAVALGMTLHIRPSPPFESEHVPLIEYGHCLPPYRAVKQHESKDFAEQTVVDSRGLAMQHNADPDMQRRRPFTQ